MFCLWSGFVWALCVLIVAMTCQGQAHTWYLFLFKHTNILYVACFIYMHTSEDIYQWSSLRPLFAPTQRTKALYVTCCMGSGGLRRLVTDPALAHHGLPSLCIDGLLMHDAPAYCMGRRRALVVRVILFWTPSCSSISHVLCVFFDCGNSSYSRWYGCVSGCVSDDAMRHWMTHTHSYSWRW